MLHHAVRGLQHSSGAGMLSRPWSPKGRELEITRIRTLCHHACASCRPPRIFTLPCCAWPAVQVAKWLSAAHMLEGPMLMLSWLGHRLCMARSVSHPKPACFMMLHASYSLSQPHGSRAGAMTFVQPVGPRQCQTDADTAVPSMQ